MARSVETICFSGYRDIFIQRVHDDPVRHGHRNQWNHQQHQNQKNSVDPLHDFRLPLLAASVHPGTFVLVVCVDRNGDHDHEGYTPDQQYTAVGVGEGLPFSGL